MCQWGRPNWPHLSGFRKFITREFRGHATRKTSKQSSRHGVMHLPCLRIPATISIQSIFRVAPVCIASVAKRVSWWRRVWAKHLTSRVWCALRMQSASSKLVRYAGCLFCCWWWPHSIWKYRARAPAPQKRHQQQTISQKAAHWHNYTFGFLELNTAIEQKKKTLSIWKMKEMTVFSVGASQCMAVQVATVATASAIIESYRWCVCVWRCRAWRHRCSSKLVTKCKMQIDRAQTKKKADAGKWRESISERYEQKHWAYGSNCWRFACSM